MNNSSRKVSEEAVEKLKKNFQEFRVAHPKLKEVTKRLLMEINSPQKGNIIIIFGPPGIGKTTLIDKIEEEILKNSNLNVGQIPLLRIELPARVKGDFNWRYFCYDALRKLNEPMIDKKIEYTNTVAYNDSREKILKANIREADLRRVFEKTLHYRAVSFCILDEAQHLIPSSDSGGRKLLDQIDIIKSFVNRSNTKFVLVGSYELLPLLHINGQLARRTIPIHFQRYLANNKELQEFVNILGVLLQQIPLKNDLNKEWEFFYERTLGCIGKLKELLSRSLTDALEEGVQTLTFQHVKAKAPLLMQCKAIHDEIRRGEKQLEESDEKWKEFDREIGLQVKEAIKIKEEKKKARKRQAGVRNPIRDPIGEQFGAAANDRE